MTRPAHIGETASAHHLSRKILRSETSCNPQAYTMDDVQTDVTEIWYGV
jgi:hypothetical protein